MSADLSMRAVLAGTGARSARGLRLHLGSNRASLLQLAQTELIHAHYQAASGPRGGFGFPIGDVAFSARTARRSYRGGDISAVGSTVQGFRTQRLIVRFLGFHCVQESSSDQLSSSDEPYFVITVDTGTGSPVTHKFGPFDGTNTGTEQGSGELVVPPPDLAPNPTAVRANVFEQDFGDPDDTAKKLQDELVKLSQAVGQAASSAGADAADGPGVGIAAAAGAVGGILAGPLGAAGTEAIVATLQLGDDFVGERVKVLWDRLAENEEPKSPPVLGKFQDNDFNIMLDVDGGDEGRYQLFFDLTIDNISHSPQ
jgi:hypothetical protein